MKLSLCLVALLPLLALLVPETGANMPRIPSSPARRTPTKTHTSAHKTAPAASHHTAAHRQTPGGATKHTHQSKPVRHPNMAPVKTHKKPTQPSKPVRKPTAPKPNRQKPAKPVRKPTKPVRKPTKPVAPKKPAHTPKQNPSNPAPQKGGKHHHQKGGNSQPQNPAKPQKKPVRANPNNKPTQPQTPSKPDVNRNVPTGKGGSGIVAAASAWKGTPYSFGGGSLDGPAKASQGYGKDISGFDCSSLARYAVHKATGKILPRTADQQWHSNQCVHVPFAQRQAGDLVFWKEGGKIGHVGIVADQDNMWHAPHHHDVVKKAKIFGDIHTKSVNMVRMGEVARCS